MLFAWSFYSHYNHLLTIYTFHLLQVAMKKSLLDSSDVFILDLGLTIFQYNGATANKDEKYKAVQYLQDLKSRRPKAQTETLEEHELVSIFMLIVSVTEIQPVVGGGAKRNRILFSKLTQAIILFYQRCTNFDKIYFFNGKVSDLTIILFRPRVMSS